MRHLIIIIFALISLGGQLAWSSPQTVDDFSGGTLNAAWVATEINWHSPAAAGDTSFNVTDHAGQLTGRRTNAHTGTLNQAWLSRNDINVAIGETLIATFKLIDPAGTANGGDTNNSFFGLAIAAGTNNSGQYGVSRYGNSSAVFGIDFRSPRARSVATATTGGLQAGADEIVNSPGVTFADVTGDGIRMAIYRESATSLKFYIAKSTGVFSQVGNGLTIDPGQMDAGFGNAVAAVIDWTSDFPNGSVEAIYDDFQIVTGPPAEPTAATPVLGTVDSFSSPTLNPEWTESEINWQDALSAGDTSWNLIDSPGTLSARRTGANTGFHNTALIMRDDVILTPGRSLRVTIRLIDPAGQADPEFKNNSFFGLILSSHDNAIGQFGTLRSPNGAVTLTIDPRTGPRVKLIARTTAGANSGDLMIPLDNDGIPTLENPLSYADLVGPGIDMAIYRESPTMIRFFIQKPGYDFSELGTGFTVDPNEMGTSFGTALGLIAEWTGDFNNSQVQALFDNLEIVEGIPVGNALPSSASDWELYQ